MISEKLKKRFKTETEYKQELKRQQSPEYKKNRRRSTNILKAKRTFAEVSILVDKANMYLELASK